MSPRIWEIALETLLWPRFAYLLEGQPLGFLLNFIFGGSLSRDFLSSRERLSRVREPHTAIPHLITLHRNCLLVGWFFNSLKVCGGPALTKFTGLFARHLLTSCLCATF